MREAFFAKLLCHTFAKKLVADWMGECVRSRQKSECANASTRSLPKKYKKSNKTDTN